MELAARGWGRNHGENLVAKRDLATAKVGRFDSYSRLETYITPKLEMLRTSAFLRGHGLSEESGIEIRFDSKIVLNGDYLVRVAFNRHEIASLFFSLYAGCSLEELLDQFNAAKSLRDNGPLPLLPFASVMLTKIDDLNLSVRAANCLKNDNVVYVGDLVQRTEAEMLRTPNFGRRALNEIKEVLAKMDQHLGQELPGWRPENIEVLARRFAELNQG